MEWLRSLDEKIFILINRGLSNPVFDFLFPHLTDLHQTIWFQIVAIPVLLYAVIKVYRKTGWLIVAGLLLSLALTDFSGGMAKRFWERPRPFTNLELEVVQRSGVGSFSFPSNHAGNMFCFAIFMGIFFPRWRWVFVIFAAIIALTRVYNGVHYPTDVLAGAMLGGSIGWCGAMIILGIIKKYNLKRPSHHLQSALDKQ